MDAAEYKHVVLGLIFLKHISDTFEEHRAQLLAGKGDYKGSIGEIIDDAMVAIERDNPRLKGVLPKDYARPAPITSASAN